jgi:hypothetical protein
MRAWWGRSWRKGMAVLGAHFGRLSYVMTIIGRLHVTMEEVSLLAEPIRIHC